MQSQEHSGSSSAQGAKSLEEDLTGAASQTVPAHTPGPWHAVGYGSTFIVTAMDRCYQVAVIQDITGNENNAANARLIAAAPDLLAALRGVLEIGYERGNELEFARAAIRAATGEKQ